MFFSAARRGRPFRSVIFHSKNTAAVIEASAIESNEMGGTQEILPAQAYRRRPQSLASAPSDQYYGGRSLQHGGVHEERT